MKTIAAAISMVSGLALNQSELPFATYPGACPEVPNQPDFDVTKYTGVWYTYIANDKRNIPENANCVAATYEILTENSISVNNTAVYDIERRNFNTMLPSWAYGSAVVLNPEYPTQLYVSFETFGGCGEYGFLCANTEKAAEHATVNAPYLEYENYRVADTDYENYSVVISCIPAGELLHGEVMYILVRDREWPAKNQAKIQELLYNVDQWGIHTEDLILTHQDDCEKWVDQGIP